MKKTFIIILSIVCSSLFAQNFDDIPWKPSFRGEVKAPALYDSNFVEYYSKETTDHTKIIAALTAKKVVIFSKTYLKSKGGNLTIPQGRTLDFSKGGDLVNYTGTITGNKTKIINPDNHQIFAPSATFAGTWDIPQIQPQWLGVDGTDTTGVDHTLFSDALQKCYDLSDNVFIPIGDYIADDSIHVPQYGTLKSERGARINLKGIKSFVHFSREPFTMDDVHVFSLDSMNNQPFINIIIDHPYGGHLSGFRENSTISNCSFQGYYYIGGGGYRGTPKQTGIRFILNSGTASYFGTIINNYFYRIDTAMYLRGSSLSGQKINTWNFIGNTFDITKNGIHIDTLCLANLFTNTVLQSLSNSRTDSSKSALVINSANNKFANLYIWDAGFWGKDGTTDGCPIIHIKENGWGTVLGNSYNNAPVFPDKIQIDDIDNNNFNVFTDTPQWWYSTKGKVHTADSVIIGVSGDGTLVKRNATLAVTKGRVRFKDIYYDSYSTNIICGGKTDSITGTQNTIFGLKAISLATFTGNQNTVFGNTAFTKPTSAAGNSIFGTASGENIVDGSQNSLFGYGTGNDITSGDYNTLVGYNAGTTVSTANYNTIIGANAGTHTNANGNTFLGYATGLTSSSGVYNTAIGNQAGYNLTSGALGVYLGYKAGYTITTGSHLYISNNTDSGTKANTWIYGNSTHDVEIPAGSLSVKDFLHLTPGKAPESPSEGDIYCNSTNHHLYFYNGSAWVQLDN